MPNQERLRFETFIVRISPPWLQRTEGGRLMRVFGRAIDRLVDASTRSISVRFPGLFSDALQYIARDRKIFRGPREGDTSLANRQRRWWLLHKGRGGPVPFLEQAFDYWQYLGAQLDLVYANGGRAVVSATGEITRDRISWNQITAGEWSEFWFVFNLGSDPTGLASTGTVDPVQLDSMRQLIQQWSPAHILNAYIVLLWDDSEELWGYPVPVGEWGELGDTWAADQPYREIYRFGRS